MVGPCTKTKFFALILSVIGFSVQVFEVSHQYFKYITTTVVTFETPDIVTNHPVAVCIRYSDIIDAESLFRESGIRLKPVAKLQDAIDNEDKLTVRQILDHTPATDQIISSCFYRPEGWAFQTSKRKECNERFNVTKFFTGELICYRIEEQRDQELQTPAVTKSTFKTLVVFDLELDRIFLQSRVALIIMFQGSLPFKSRENIALIPTLKVPQSNQSIYNTFYATPQDTRVLRLEAPYDTKCTNIADDHKYICKKQCLIQKYREFNRLPGFELLTQRHDLKPLSTNDLKNQTIKRLSDQFVKQCSSKCFVIPCTLGFSETIVLPHLRSGMEFTLSSVIAHHPDTHTRAQATMSFIDYFSFVCSCIGTWFGVSFLTLEPSRLLMRRKQNTRVSGRM